MSDKLPKALLDAIKDGNIILFLGAGAAFDSIHKNWKNDPNGNPKLESTKMNLKQLHNYKNDGRNFKSFCA